ncbi:hypothetical protein GbCGDNIH6_8291 [Granulibacter bethesdensis]|nr:hypothetical protein GbCGDNIH6_8291 [Granulibacter bethesdensis]
MPGRMGSNENAAAANAARLRDDIRMGHPVENETMCCAFVSFRQYASSCGKNMSETGRVHGNPSMMPMAPRCSENERAQCQCGNQSGRQIRPISSRIMTISSTRPSPPEGK